MKYTYLLIAFILVLFLYNSVNVVENMESNIAPQTIIYQNQDAISDIEEQLEDIIKSVNEAEKMAKQNQETIRKSQQAKAANSQKVKETASKLPTIPPSQKAKYEATLKKYS